MKKTWMIAGVAGVMILGGAFGVSAVSNDGQWSDKNVKVSQKQAEDTAVKEVEGLEITKVEKDVDDGVQKYEVKGMTKDGQEMDVDIHAESGEVLEVDREDSDSDSDQVSAADLKVDQATAEKTAEQETGGTITESEVDDGHFEFELVDDTHEYDVTVDGQTGEVIEYEKEKK
ncbi:PepSY domain-containing protein [Halobacillus sp. ACCC02827]|uniref:PepSY domain-containing protein n=1 Tax=Bacillaceae TaxID=186817 RepID=UPI0003FED5F4|nr:MULTISPECIES: PepSY domain-containing protein [Bacillaceae]QHT47712.1 hypothetical protein M662_14885 [Bacillus sp. SB49]WJE14951.1 PepSY domain-containing protein [Halobacillus sp. ACCC02827]